jgi:AraC-like DNA-binding protein
MDYSVSFVRDYCQFLNSFQMPNEELYKVLDTSSIKMNLPFLRVKADKVNLLFDHAIKKTGDNEIGLKLPCEPWYVPDKVIHMLMWNSKAPLEAMKTACKYLKLITTTFVAILTEEESNFSIEFKESSEWLKNKDQWMPVIKTSLDVAFSTVQNTFTKMFNKENVYPIELRITLEKPANDALYYEIFKCPIYFNQPKNIIVYDKSVLFNEKNQYYDRKTYENVVKFADDIIRQQISRTDEFVTIVENEILSQTGQENEFPTIEKVATSLNMSIRSFQRKLEEENQSYKEVLDNVRKTFALNYIQNNERYNVSELAYYLGYSDASAFIKAFKRWYGVTPAKYGNGDQ